MIDIGIVYYRMGREENTIDAIWYTSRLNKKETGKGVARWETSFPGCRDRHIGWDGSRLQED